MSQLRSIASRLRALAQDATPLSASVGASARQLKALGQQVESLGRSGVDIGPLVAALRAAEVQATAAAHAASQVKADGVAWADDLIRGPGGSSGDGGVGLSTTLNGPTTGTGYNLSSDDISALEDYTGSGFREMNQMSRGQVPFDPQVEARARAVSAALGKLPDHEGQVIRGANLAGVTGHGGWSTWQAGSEVRIPEFFSSDIDNAFAGDTLFSILSKRGKRVEPYSTFHRQENEVLFDRGTRFRVQSHVVHPRTGKHIIQIEEL